MIFEDKKVDNNDVTPKKASWSHIITVCFILGMCILLVVLLLSGSMKENDFIIIDFLIRIAGMLLGLISLHAFSVKTEFNIYSHCTWPAWSWPEIVFGLIAGAVFMLRGVTFFIMIADAIRQF
jgi:hypothetical protein